MSVTCFNRPRAYVPTVTLQENTIDSGDELVDITVETVSTYKKTVTLTVAETGHWLLRVWLTDGPDITEQVSADVPSVSPATNDFYLTTDESGEATFDIEDSVPGTWYVMAAVLGKVHVSNIPVTVGV